MHISDFLFGELHIGFILNTHALNDRAKLFMFMPNVLQNNQTIYAEGSILEKIQCD